MKRNYTGLSIRRVRIEGQPLMQASVVKFKAKTKVKDWNEEKVDLEMGMTDIEVSTLE